uniref:D-aminoacyl-tRNA deacylase n=1 Tax=Xenopsylla cheopis TaxID=163159 RepID=A0A6M2DIP6_XENCH
MKALIQRVTEANVKVKGELISSIGKGLCILVGISANDTEHDMKYLVQKILNVRLFENNDGIRWSQNVKQKDYEVLCVSQFTLYATLKKNKPDFHHSMAAAKSQQLYNDFLAEMKTAYDSEKIKDGVFGEYMEVNIQNDGPVTIEIESPNKTDISKCE